MAISPDATSLNQRRRAMMRRNSKQRMESFRLPKETTKPLLHIHAEDEPENDDMDNQDNSSLLERRRMSLQRTRKSMTSFRVPKDKTPELLRMSSIAVDEEPAVSLPITRPPLAPRRVSGLQNHNRVQRMTSFRIAKEQTKSLLQVRADQIKESPKPTRIRALRLHNQNTRMTSFRLPKESTKTLLHWSAQAEKDDSGKTLLPRELIRQSSFNARTA